MSKKKPVAAVIETAPANPAPAPKILAYKGFDADFACRGHRFAVGQSYEAEGVIKACRNGFHACEYPLSVFEYYPPANNRFALVELDGDRMVEGDKTAARRITIVRELSIREMTEAAVEYTKARIQSENEARNDEAQGAATASGRQGAATASGDWGAATASGWQGAATASGDGGAATASGWQGAATASGEQGAATASGDWGAATASGYDGKVRGKDGCALFLVERADNRDIIAVWAGIAGRDGIKADTFYHLVGGKPVEIE